MVRAIGSANSEHNKVLSIIIFIADEDSPEGGKVEVGGSEECVSQEAGPSIYEQGSASNGKEAS